MEKVNAWDSVCNGSTTHIWVMFVDENDDVVVEIAKSPNHSIYHSKQWGDSVACDCDFRGYFKETNGVLTCHVSFPRKYLKVLNAALKAANLVAIYRTFEIDTNEPSLSQIGYKYGGVCEVV